MMVYTLKSFNTGQITLPKARRSKFKTKHFIAEEHNGGLLIKPLLEKDEDDDVMYYEDNIGGFGIHFKKPISAEKLLEEIKKHND